MKYVICLGPESVEATNVFYHVTYPGSVNWNAITDEYQLKVNLCTPAFLITETLGYLVIENTMCICICAVT